MNESMNILRESVGSKECSAQRQQHLDLLRQNGLYFELHARATATVDYALYVMAVIALLVGYAVPGQPENVTVLRIVTGVIHDLFPLFLLVGLFLTFRKRSYAIKFMIYQESKGLVPSYPVREWFDESSFDSTANSDETVKNDTQKAETSS